jgi:hypothetical protein
MIDEDTVGVSPYHAAVIVKVPSVNPDITAGPVRVPLLSE